LTSNKSIPSAFGVSLFICIFWDKEISEYPVTMRSSSLTTYCSYIIFSTSKPQPRRSKVPNQAVTEQLLVPLTSWCMTARNSTFIVVGAYHAHCSGTTWLLRRAFAISLRPLRMVQSSWGKSRKPREKDRPTNPQTRFPCHSGWYMCIVQHAIIRKHLYDRETILLILSKICGILGNTILNSQNFIFFILTIYIGTTSRQSLFLRQAPKGRN